MRPLVDSLLVILLGFLCSCVVSCSKTDSVLEVEEDFEFVFSPSDSVLLKPDLKVLDIGNSYTNDATSLLPFLVKKLGLDLSDMCLYKATLGGASFIHWYRVYNDSSSDSYEVKRVIGGLGANVTEGEGKASVGRGSSTIQRCRHQQLRSRHNRRGVVSSRWYIASIGYHQKGRDRHRRCRTTHGLCCRKRDT